MPGEVRRTAVWKQDGLICGLRALGLFMPDHKELRELGYVSLAGSCRYQINGYMIKALEGHEDEPSHPKTNRAGEGRCRATKVRFTKSFLSLEPSLITSTHIHREPKQDEVCCPACRSRERRRGWLFVSRCLLSSLTRGRYTAPHHWPGCCWKGTLGAPLSASSTPKISPAPNLYSEATQGKIAAFSRPYLGLRWGADPPRLRGKSYIVTTVLATELMVRTAGRAARSIDLSLTALHGIWGVLL